MAWGNNLRKIFFNFCSLNNSQSILFQGQQPHILYRHTAHYTSICTWPLRGRDETYVILKKNPFIMSQFGARNLSGTCCTPWKCFLWPQVKVSRATSKKTALFFWAVVLFFFKQRYYVRRREHADFILIKQIIVYFFWKTKIFWKICIGFLSLFVKELPISKDWRQSEIDRNKTHLLSLFV